jgi:hypothetical protein
MNIFTSDMSSFVLPIIDFDLYMRDKTTLAAINECKKVEILYVGHIKCEIYFQY